MVLDPDEVSVAMAHDRVFGRGWLHGIMVLLPESGMFQLRDLRTDKRRLTRKVSVPAGARSAPSYSARNEPFGGSVNQCEKEEHEALAREKQVAPPLIRNPLDRQHRDTLLIEG